MKIFFGGVTQHPLTGKLGSRVRVDVGMQDGWSGHYEFDTHGLSPTDASEKIAGLRAYHTKKAARLDGFSRLLGLQFSVDGRTFELTDCTVLERGGEVELRVGAQETTTGKQQGIDGLPTRRRYQTIDDVPADGAIISLLLDVIQRRVSTDAAHIDFVQQTAALLPAATIPDLPVKVNLP